MYIVVNELEKDVFREIISIGLARAADSFSNFPKAGVLLNVPEVKIIEPKVLPDVIDEYEEIYFVIRSDITGELNGKTFYFLPKKILEDSWCLPGWERAEAPRITGSKKIKMH